MNNLALIIMLIRYYNDKVEWHYVTVKLRFDGGELCFGCNLTTIRNCRHVSGIQPASIGSVRFVVFDDPLTRHLYMLS